MKPTIFLATIFAALTLNSSCTYNDDNDSPYFYSEYFSVKKNQWKVGQDDSGIYYYYQIRVPDLTTTVYNYGMMNAYMVYDPEGNGVEVLTPLPFNDYWVDSQTGFMWEEQVTCEFSPGYVTFILKYSDHADAEPYYDYDFLVRFMW